MKFLINTTFESTDIIYYFESFFISTENRKVMKIFIKIKLASVLFVDLELSVHINDKNGDLVQIYYVKNNAKKQYNGTNVITIDVSRIECYDYAEASIIRGMKYITLNNMTLEFEESFSSIDFKSFKNAISNYIY